MEQHPHYFFAVKIPEETKWHMKDRIEKIKEILPFCRWVHYLDLHITLAFLGSASEESLHTAANNVKHVIEGSNSFPLNINKLGVFGKENSPRVFWAATEESRELTAFRKVVFSACEKAGFKLETRPFRPHITIARKWGGDVPFHEDLLKVWEKIQPDPLSFQAKEIVLYRTHLDQLPKYEAIKIYPLQV